MSISMDVRVQIFTRNEIIYKIGDYVRDIYFVKNGSVEIYDFIDISREEENSFMKYI